jgi:hypothetical protein
MEERDPEFVWIIRFEPERGAFSISGGLGVV